MEIREFTEEDKVDSDGERVNCAFSGKKIKLGQKIAKYEWYDARVKSGK